MPSFVVRSAADRPATTRTTGESSAEPSPTPPRLRVAQTARRADHPDRARDRDTTETVWVAHLDDVSPDGVSRPLTQGALLGSLRALDP